MDYEPFLTAEMGHRGYTGVFYPKEMGTNEGLATFWKRDKFELVEVRKLSYNSMLAEECVKREIDPDELRGERPHVFLVTKLLHLTTNKIITLGNIHTVWDNFSQLDVTTLQVMRFSVGNQLVSIDNIDIRLLSPSLDCPKSQRMKL